MPASAVDWHIYGRLFSPHARLWRNLRLLFGGDPYDAEYAFTLEVARAASPRDVENAFRSYLHNPLRTQRHLPAWLRLTPDRNRALRYFHSVMNGGD